MLVVSGDELVTILTQNLVQAQMCNDNDDGDYCVDDQHLESKIFFFFLERSSVTSESGAGEEVGGSRYYDHWSFFLTGLIFVITFVSLRDGPFQYLPDGPNKIF